jgi:hypothetical protein
MPYALLVQGDARALPFADAAFSLHTSAFGGHAMTRDDLHDRLSQLCAEVARLQRLVVLTALRGVSPCPYALEVHGLWIRMSLS